MIDAGLRRLLRTHLPTAHWQAVETWSTGQGVPDTEYCFPGGYSGWVECKKVSGGLLLDHPLSPEQVAWLERRSRAGGLCWVAVRRLVPAGPRRGRARDELWLYRGREARGLLSQGLRRPPLGLWEGGPRAWDWGRVEALLRGQK